MGILSNSNINKENVQETEQKEQSEQRKHNRQSKWHKQGEQYKQENKVDSLSKFICTVNKPIYFISLALALAFMLEITTFSKLDIRLAYFLSLAEFIIIGIAVYKISKALKVKRDTLEIKQLSKMKKLGFLVISFVVGIIVTLILSLYEVSSMTSNYHEYINQNTVSEQDSTDMSRDNIDRENIAGE